MFMMMMMMMVVVDFLTILPNDEHGFSVIPGMVHIYLREDKVYKPCGPRASREILRCV